MAARYWVGGTDFWDATAGTKWATTSGGVGGASVPSSSDDVYIDANSGAVTVTASGTVSCRHLVCTGFTGTLAGGGFDVYGNLTFDTTHGVNINGSVRLYGNVTPCSANFADKTLNWNLSFTGTVSSVFNLTGNVTSLGIMYVQGGTFNASTYNITARVFAIGVSGVSTTVNMGSGAWTVSQSGTGTQFSWNIDATAAAGTTVNAQQSTIVLRPNSGNTSRWIFNGAGKTYNNLTLVHTDVANRTVDIRGSNTFNRIARVDETNGSWYDTYTITFQGGTTTNVGSWGLSGYSEYNVVQIQSISPGTTYTLNTNSLTPLEGTYLDISDCVATPSNTWYAPLSIDSGNNTGWTFDYAPYVNSANVLFFGCNF